MTTTLQYHDHAIERCDATTGHAVVTVALCRDTATARMLVDAYNSNERLQQREQVLREALEKIMVGACPSSVNAQRLADNLEAVCHEVYDISRAALAATEVQP